MILYLHPMQYRIPHTNVIYIYHIKGLDFQWFGYYNWLHPLLSNSTARHYNFGGIICAIGITSDPIIVDWTIHFEL